MNKQRAESIRGLISILQNVERNFLSVGGNRMRYEDIGSLRCVLDNIQHILEGDK